jgi:hypothetical protein
MYTKQAELRVRVQQQSCKEGLAGRPVLLNACIGCYGHTGLVDAE